MRVTVRLAFRWKCEKQPAAKWRVRSILSPYGKETWLPLLAALAAATVASALCWPWACVLLVPALLCVLWFFRDPERSASAPDNALISSADGKIVEIATADEPEHIGRPATRIAVFMSVFDVHVNRAPCGAIVEWIRHEPGRFINALRPQASIENERTLIALRDRKKRPVLVKLVAGLIARRIVCRLEPGAELARGQRLGMIEFGSRVELFVPTDEGFKVTVKLGQRVRAGETILGEWR